MSQTYRSAGVDVNAGYNAVQLIKKRAAATMRDEVFSGIGGFNAMFSIAAAKKMEEPMLVSGTDGVGTKLKVAFVMDKHDTVGQDCVAMCVNDIICSGAEPLFLLDYIACGKLVPSKIDAIVCGIAAGCSLAGTALVGGETAEMPGFYKEFEYDLAGFVVGIVDKARAFKTTDVQVGDALIGIASNGVHSNGFSLIRKIMRLSENSLAEFIQTLGTTLGEELLKPTRIYAKTILSLKDKLRIHSVSHITGGGFIENIPRMLPAGDRPGAAALIRRGSWRIHPIFDIMRATGDIPEAEMFNIFNMGIGMVMAVAAEDVQTALSALKKSGEQAYVIGEVISGDSAAAQESVVYKSKGICIC
ncbi:MAG: phosphoribosylformylglycinamidine cyclo-ligase [Clostridiales bacterium]|jgi:phosphoribosylformylglycinamidine cyclo-ligase|nr:phosphoribosylformylglycinamidine cyclo-ligase [Clostridiales bacterium]